MCGHKQRHWTPIICIIRDVEIFLDMPVIWPDFENLVSPNKYMQQKISFFVSPFEILSVKIFGLTLFDIAALLMYDERDFGQLYYKPMAPGKNVDNTTNNSLLIPTHFILRDAFNSVIFKGSVFSGSRTLSLLLRFCSYCMICNFLCNFIKAEIDILSASIGDKMERECSYWIFFISFFCYSFMHDLYVYADSE